MCFSAEASFSAGILLTAVGAAAIKKAPSKPFLFLGAIPFLFGLQQFSEGFIWLYLKGSIESKEIFAQALNIYLAIAFFIWPIWSPLSLATIEEIPWRRNLIILDLFCGVLLSFTNLLFTVSKDVSVNIVGHSLQYTGHIPEQVIIYTVIVMLPLILSTLKHIRIYAALVFVSYLVAYYFYSQASASVWCFFAALVSLFIYKILKDIPQKIESKKEFKI